MAVKATISSSPASLKPKSSAAAAFRLGWKQISGPLFRKYIILFMVVVGVLLVSNEMVEILFFYSEYKVSRVSIQQEQAEAAAEAAYMPKGMVAVPFNPQLINTGSKLILIDCGNGVSMLEPSKGRAGRTLQNLAAAGRKFILQGGTHLNLAVVKAQVDFIRTKVQDAEIVVHPYSGEAGAIGAALCAGDMTKPGTATRFRGYDVIESLEYTSTTNEHTTCTWCPVSCKRTFIDVRLPNGTGRPWSKLPLAAGWERVISGNSCPKGLLEDVNEMRVVKKNLEVIRDAHPNTAELVRESAFRRAKPVS